MLIDFVTDALAHPVATAALVPAAFYLGVRIYSPCATRPFWAASGLSAGHALGKIGGWLCAITPFAVIVILAYRFPAKFFSFAFSYMGLLLVAPVIFCSGWELYKALGLLQGVASSSKSVASSRPPTIM